jgi:translation initiation factor IF-2
MALSEEEWQTLLERVRWTAPLGGPIVRLDWDEAARIKREAKSRESAQRREAKSVESAQKREAKEREEAERIARKQAAQAIARERTAQAQAQRLAAKQERDALKLQEREAKARIKAEEEQRRADRAAAALEKYETVMGLTREGKSAGQIARLLGVSRPMVVKYRNGMGKTGSYERRPRP